MKINGEGKGLQLENLAADPAAGKDGRVFYDTVAGKPKLDNGTSIENIVTSTVIQDYTVVGNVGDAGQFMAGYTGWTIAELEHFFGAGKIYSYNKFATGALGTDTNGAYDYTMGAAAKAPSDGIGIEGIAGTAISFDGGDYATNATKLDNMTTVFSGAGKGFIHSFWVIAPTDGQPSGVNRLFYKTNSAVNDYYGVKIETSGQVVAMLKGVGLAANILNSTSILPNGANTIWTHVVVTWSTARGGALYINRINEATDSTAINMMADNVGGTPFYIGATDATPANPFTGRIAQEIIINKVAEQRDIDILFATTRPEPAILAGKEYTVIDKVRPEADANYEYQGMADVLAKYNDNIYLQGRQWGEADSVKLIGQVI